jgi:hypothetical protein
LAPVRSPHKARPESLLDHALQYAARGWQVLPLVARRKIPKTRTGVLEASADAAQVIEWWQRWPNANIGLRTGAQFDVLDIDGEGGVSSLVGAAGPEHRHSGPVAFTGKGQHWLFAPGNTANRAGLLPDIDWRGTNGYIVAPPSVHPDGHIYAWDPERDEHTDLPPVPEWLTPYLTQWVSPEDEKTVLVLKTQPHSRNNPQKIVAYGLRDNIAGRLIDIVQTAIELEYAPRPDGGGRYKIHCPFHEGDNEASMKLYPADNSFYCYGCGAWGDSLNLQQHRPGGPRG